MRLPRRLAALALGLALLAVPAAGEDSAVDLELVLAVDVSMSMDMIEQRLQRDGYVAAFRHREVVDAIGSGYHRAIAVTYVEWAGELMQRTVVPWTRIASPAEAEAFAASLAEAPMSRTYRTSISSGLAYAAASFEVSGFAGERQVIDISGDGPNNQGLPVLDVRDQLLARGVVINGLPIILRPGGLGYFDLDDLVTYYRDCVIGGPGAFLIPVRDAGEFGQAIRRKLVIEISGLAPVAEPAQAAPGAGTGVDCLVGERLWRRWIERSD